jgi:hypothetical protein
MVKKEIIISIFVYNRRKIHCNNNMFYSGTLYEANFARYTSKV